MPRTILNRPIRPMGKTTPPYPSPSASNKIPSVMQNNPRTESTNNSRTYDGKNLTGNATPFTVQRINRKNVTDRASL